MYVPQNVDAFYDAFWRGDGNIRQKIENLVLFTDIKVQPIASKAVS
jgi:hypothetical protein